MAVCRIFTFPLLAGLLLSAPAFAGQKAKPEQAPRPNQQQQQQRQQQRAQPQPRPDNRPGDELFLRLQRMTPEEREKALSQLPPARRAQIEQHNGYFRLSHVFCTIFTSCATCSGGVSGTIP